MNTLEEIVDVLKDGEFHSGEDLAALLNVSRTTVWARIQKIRKTLNLDIYSVSGRGYKISRPLILLNKDDILADLNDKNIINHVDIFSQIDSTNQFLLDRQNVSKKSFDVCLAEMQHNGRGRRGRQWVSPFGQNLYLSLSRNFSLPMQQMSGISLVAGVCVAKVLEEFGLAEVALKWPNDIHLNDHKIAGLLIEVRGEAEGPVKVVIGIGVNFSLSSTIRREIDQQVADIAEFLGAKTPNRNRFVAALLNEMDNLVNQFVTEGLQPILKEWQKYDRYIHHQVSIISGENKIDGIYRGLDKTGSLLLEVNDKVRAFNAGEVSLRKSQ